MAGRFAASIRTPSRASRIAVPLAPTGFWRAGVYIRRIPVGASGAAIRLAREWRHHELKEGTQGLLDRLWFGKDFKFIHQQMDFGTRIGFAADGDVFENLGCQGSGFLKRFTQ